ncbi:hypothetical protein [Mesorhizobium sp.]|uniref:hypothetical protein n=1 Tax=Mesorhizobium sp. TaxID=1871066 RepID=UPI00257E687E|nr:hypothetical protein [Mesorhizobium sp.]
MSFDDHLDSEQLATLARVLNDYCTEAGIPKGHPARDHFGRRLISLFRSGIDQPDDLKSKMNAGYEDWLGEIGATGPFIPPKLSSEDRLVARIGSQRQTSGRENTMSCESAYGWVAPKPASMMIWER